MYLLVLVIGKHSKFNYSLA